MIRLFSTYPVGTRTLVGLLGRRRLLISARASPSISRFLFVMRNVAPIETLHVRLTSNF